LLSEKLIREQNIFNYIGIINLQRKLFSNSPEDAVAQVWGLIVFQYWWKKYFN
jgi:asparagine synthase (glutamine-hydrolysing)